MKRYFWLAVVIAVLFGVAIGPQQTKAQVYSQYKEVTIVKASYETLDDYTELDPFLFALPPNFTPMNRDDGYYKQPIPLPFKFEYNDEIYDQIWVNVNGFVMFTMPGVIPPNIAPDYNGALFVQSNSYPNNVIAPFWGDHYLRTNQDKITNKYLPGHIRYGWKEYKPGKLVFIIEWVDLNIMDERVQSSVATFQVRFYQSEDLYSYQGDIEFCYSRTGSPDLDPTVGDLVIIRGGTVGLKGETSGVTGDAADYVNGLYYDQPSIFARSKTDSTTQWPPSDGATDNRIRFITTISQKVDDFWGDGDANISKAVGKRHFGMPQNRYVTVEDVRVIMHSVATNVPLDSLRRREAYHGDVTHNGRFYFDQYGEKQYIPWRSEEYYQDLPEGLSTTKKLYFQVTEYDASMILHYLAARVPELPWIYDYYVRKGKVGEEEKIADNINIGEITALGNGHYSMPIYINGYNNNAFAFKFDINGEIVDAQGEGVGVVMNGSTLVGAADVAELDQTKPVAYVTFKTDNNYLEVNGLRVNDINKPSLKRSLNGEESNEVLLQNTPNPFSGATSIGLNIAEAGHYTLEIYDVLGNVVKVLANGEMNGAQSFIWDGTDSNGNQVGSGVYVYKLSGENTTVSKKLVLSR